MKNYLYFLSLFMVAVIFYGCKKEGAKPVSLASINIVNASVNLGAVKANFTGKQNIFGTTVSQVAFGANAVYTISAGKPVPVVISAAIDTLHTVYSKSLNLAAGSSYSLYLAGQAGAVDTLFSRDDIPYHTLKDSVMGVRFINLSYNSTPINVTLAAAPDVNETSNLAYKQISNFITYPALKTNAAYVFQFRNAATNALLASLTLSGTTIPRFNNITLALKGLAGGSLSIQRINNY